MMDADVKNPDQTIINKASALQGNYNFENSGKSWEGNTNLLA